MKLFKKFKGKRNRRKALPVQAVCRNCGAKLNGPYCSQCGQYLFAGIKRSVGDFMFNMLENIFALDNKVLITLKYLIFFPGKLTKEYIQGRIVRYVHPSKLFWFVIIISLFLASAKFSGIDNDEEENELAKQEVKDMRKYSDSLKTAVADSVSKELLRAGILTNEKKQNKGQPVAKPDTAKLNQNKDVAKQSAKKAKITDTLQAVAKADSTVKKADKRKDNKAEIQRFKSEFQSNIFTFAPYVILLLIPFFTFLLYILFRKQKYFYVDHMAFAFHFHAFLFILFSCGLAISLIWPGLNYDYEWWLALIPMFYFVLAVRTVYKPRVWGLIWKTLLVMFVYAMVIAIVMLTFVVLVIQYVGEPDESGNFNIF